jgi:hypothetical protein
MLHKEWDMRGCRVAKHAQNLSTVHHELSEENQIAADKRASSPVRPMRSRRSGEIEAPTDWSPEEPDSKDAAQGEESLAVLIHDES